MKASTFLVIAIPVVVFGCMKFEWALEHFGVFAMFLFFFLFALALAVIKIGFSFTKQCLFEWADKQSPDDPNYVAYKEKNHSDRELKKSLKLSLDEVEKLKNLSRDNGKYNWIIFLLIPLLFFFLAWLKGKGYF